MKKTLEQIAVMDGRFDVKALRFVFEGLGSTIDRLKQTQEHESDDIVTRHISGSELSEGLASIAVQRWGRLARMVLNQWGVRTTRDMGEIVYLMIEHGWMSSQETDSIEDFDDAYDFEEVFEKRFDFRNDSDAA